MKGYQMKKAKNLMENLDSLIGQSEEIVESKQDKNKVETLNDIADGLLRDGKIKFRKKIKPSDLTHELVFHSESEAKKTLNDLDEKGISASLVDLVLTVDIDEDKEDED